MAILHFEGAVALVTGGSAGIGREIARALAAKGAHLVILGRDEAGLRAVAAELPGRMEILVADISAPAEQERVIAEVPRRWPQLSILVNNAGIQINLPATGVGDAGLLAEMREELAINLMAPMALSFGLMPLMARQPRAAIVNISSGLALSPKRTAPGYCASKAGLRTFSRTLRYRCRDAAPSIHVADAIMPLVDTRMTRGRGRQKMAACEAARQVVAGLEAGKEDIWVGKTRLLHMLHRFAPAMAYRLLRNG